MHMELASLFDAHSLTQLHLQQHTGLRHRLHHRTSDALDTCFGTERALCYSGVLLALRYNSRKGKPISEFSLHPHWCDPYHSNHSGWYSTELVVFTSDHPGPVLTFFFLIGAACPIVLWLITRRYPNTILNYLKWVLYSTKFLLSDRPCY